jgi:hypothetical protein
MPFTCFRPFTDTDNPLRIQRRLCIMLSTDDVTLIPSDVAAYLFAGPDDDEKLDDGFDDIDDDDLDDDEWEDEFEDEDEEDEVEWPSFFSDNPAVRPRF